MAIFTRGEKKGRGEGQGRRPHKPRVRIILRCKKKKKRKENNYVSKNGSILILVNVLQYFLKIFMSFHCSLVHGMKFHFRATG